MNDLLFLLCHFPFDISHRDALSRALREVGDWNEAVRLINAHGIIALAAYNIKEAGLESEVPAAAMEVLENGYFQSITRNIWLAEHWKEVNNILTIAGIMHILLKGMALEHTIYGGQGLRQMNDNDILIRPTEAIAAWKLLTHNGYSPEPFKSPLFRKIMFDFGRHLPALSKDGYVVEIHTRLDDRATIENENTGSLFDAAQEILIGGTKAFVLPEAVHLKYLVSHFEHHKMAGDCQLRLYTDIRLLDRSGTIDFPGQFIANPIQSSIARFRKAAYRSNIHSIKPEYRLRFIIGDTFPSLNWMKKRYSCNGARALLYYPLRIWKLGWLI